MHVLFYVPTQVAALFSKLEHVRAADVNKFSVLTGL